MLAQLCYAARSGSTLPEVNLPICEASDDSLAVQHVHTADDAVETNAFFQDGLLARLEPFRCSWPVVHKGPAEQREGDCD